MIRLHYSVRSPFARRVRLALGRLDVKFETSEVNVFEPTAELLAVNPLGLVPAMKWQGESIVDSATILEVLHEEHGRRLWPEDSTLRRKVRSASALAEGIMTQTVALYLENLRKEKASPDWQQDYTDSILRTLVQIEEKILPSKVLEQSDELTQAGWDTMVALEYLNLRAPQLDWAGKYLKLHHFYRKHWGHKLLRATAPPPA